MPDERTVMERLCASVEALKAERDAAEREVSDAIRAEQALRNETFTLRRELEGLRLGMERLAQERNEARQIARELLREAEPDHWDWSRMVKRYPWLADKETPGSEEMMR